MFRNLEKYITYMYFTNHGSIFVHESQEIISFFHESRQLKIGIHGSRENPFPTPLAKWPVSMALIKLAWNYTGRVSTHIFFCMN